MRIRVHLPGRKWVPTVVPGPARCETLAGVVPYLPEPTSPPVTPEQQARQTIDAMLAAAGWAVQDYRAFNPRAARGIALREVPLAAGQCDYLLLVDRKAVGVVEAKKVGT